MNFAAVSSVDLGAVQTPGEVHAGMIRQGIASRSERHFENAAIVRGWADRCKERERGWSTMLER